jgi:hypothetical protein
LESSEPGNKSGSTRYNPAIWASSVKTSDLPSREFFENLVRDLRSDQGWGREKITSHLQGKYGVHAFPWSSKTVEKMYEGVSKGPRPNLASFDFKCFAGAELPYLMKLDLLKRSMFREAALTRVEAATAARLSHFFNSPNGYPVDLYPQLAIIDAYARSSEAGKPRQHLNSLLAYQPWDLDNTALYTRALDKGWVQLPYIPMLTESTEGDYRLFTPRKHVIGAYAHLRIPKLTYYSKVEAEFINAALNIAGVQTYEDLAVDCDWKDLVERCMNGEFSAALNPGW